MAPPPEADSSPEPAAAPRAPAALEQPHDPWSYADAPPPGPGRRTALTWVLVLTGIAVTIGLVGWYLVSASGAGAAGACGGG